METLLWCKGKCGIKIGRDWREMYEVTAGFRYDKVVALPEEDGMKLKDH